MLYNKPPQNSVASSYDHLYSHFFRGMSCSPDLVSMLWTVMLPGLAHPSALSVHPGAQDKEVLEAAGKCFSWQWQGYQEGKVQSAFESTFLKKILFIYS